MTFEETLDRFQARRVGANYMARCPAHEDHTPSLSISEKDGKILLKCFAGCSNENVLAAIGMTFADLFPNGTKPKASAQRTKDTEKAARIPANVVATYGYVDEEGKLLFEVQRFEEPGKKKNFSQRRPDGRGGWIANLTNVRRVLYNLPAVLREQNILVVEGERDVHKAWDMDLAATCNPMGADTWEDSYAESLRGKNVTIIPDNDEPGRKHAEQVARSLAGKAASLAILNLPEPIKDLSDWPLSRESLLELIKAAPPWKETEGVGIKMLDETQSKDMNWLWPNRIPAGYLSVFSGNPDVGKTTIAMDLVARYTTGREWPDGTPNTNPPGYVLLMIAEDGAEDVIKPRLVAAGADCSRIGIMHAKIPTGDKKERYFTLDQDLEKLERRLKEPPSFSLVVADPLSSYLGKADMNKEQDVRRVFGPIKEMCERTGITFWGLGHFNKRTDVSALGAVSGAVANTGLPRAVFLCMKDPRGEKGDMLMLLGKGNLTQRRTGLRYRFREEKVICDNGKPNFVPVIEWRGEETEDADTLNETARNPEAKASLRAERFLREFLKDDEKPSTEILAAAQTKGISRSTLFRVKKELNVRASQKAGVWWWQPFESQPQTAEEDSKS